VDLTPEQEWEYAAGLDEKGETQVRSELEHGQIPPRFVHLASKWLSDREREAKRRGEVFQSEQMELMRRDSTARANTRANIALLIAAVSLIVSTFSLFKH